MKEIHTEIGIDASAEKVWQVLTEFADFPQWNPFVRSIEGELTTGSQLTVRLEPTGGKGMTFKPTVLKAEPAQELRWIGHLMFPGIFDGEHHFIIEAQDDKRVRLVQGERFTGILVPLMAAMGLFKNTQQGFEAMNRALKARAEEEGSEQAGP